MKKSTSSSSSPRIAHIDFNVEKELLFVKYVKYLSNPMHVAWRNFVAGAFHGLGFILGTAILLALFAWILRGVISELPFFQDLGMALDVWLEETLENQR